jgi:hypothetical protein
MKKITYLLMATIFVLASCGRVKEKTKETIKDIGETAGSAVSELGKGVKEGVEDSFEFNIETSDKLKNNGIELGKVIFNEAISNESTVSVYTIFNQAYSDTLIAKAFDKNNKEIGRSKVLFEGVKDEAKYIEIEFNELTNLDYDSKITID